MPLQINSKVITGSPGASLYDIGDGVALIELHTQAYPLDDDSLRTINEALDRVEKEFVGLVVGNEGEDFCTHPDAAFVLREAKSQNWEALARRVKQDQNIHSRLRSFPRPVVAAPSGKALGGGCALILHASRTVAAAETNIGFDEFKYGLLPAGGGIKELMRRISNPAINIPGAIPLPFLQRVFDLVGQARVSSSAEEARQLGLLAPADRIVLDKTSRLVEARREVLHLAAVGCQPPAPELIYVGGQEIRAVMRVNAWMLKEASYISAFDFLIADKLAAILAGGELSRPAWASQQYILDLECEAFLSLCGEEKTQARLESVLKTGKPGWN